ncbi:ABC transporter substrate-binding protein [Pseudoclavibacter sp. VKM Ac-2888]|uniref:ABC transporter substrate-binding protein n=1 Tax=Pseudoclavibacter sp. VKM Ac-2888 TaxID=2783830 RepID=UPI00188D0D19|nr:ABC transporter substrate-binding protein [Pseudoclavibacter sp. VKM Ac-2888]MBF4552091.1 hypothetical protein [Pseudoclavibacter sp. VKM Ac-2888]
MRSHRLRVGTAVAMLGITTLAVTACSTGSSSASEDATFAVNIAALEGAPTFDPAANMRGSAFNYAAAAYESLVTSDAEGALQPGVATAWEYTSPTELTMDFRLDSVFEDGSPMTVELIKANLERYQETPGTYQARLNSIDAIEVVDEDTLKFSLNTPDQSLPEAFSLTVGMMVSQAALDDPTLLLTDTYGSGPWILDSYTEDSEYSYIRNPEYAGPMDVQVDELNMFVITDLTAQLNALLAGDVDIISAQWSQRDQAESQGFAAASNESNVGGLMLFDRGGDVIPELGDVRVRQAINYALDRDAIGTALWSDYQRGTSSVFGKFTSAYDESLDDYYEYNPEKAKQLLAEAGYADGFELPILSRTMFGENKRLEATIPYLEAVGITATLSDRTNDYFDAITNKEFGASQGQQNGGIDSYVNSMNMLAPNAQLNPFGTDDPELTALIADASSELDADAAATKWQAVNKWVVENAWFAPVAFYHTHTVWDAEKLGGVELAAGQVFPLPFSWTPAE